MKTVSYQVKVDISYLNIRSKASIDSRKKGFIKPGIYDIDAESDGKGAIKWGHLKSGAGWISLDYCKKVDSDIDQAINKLSKIGVINSPDYWKEHYSDTLYVRELLIKSASIIKTAGKRMSTVSEAVESLVDAGIINTPEYWRSQKGTVADLLKALGGAVSKGTKPTNVSEAALRKKVCDIINEWVGAERGSATHLMILKIYNEHKPLARGYTVKVNDAHCATTTSAAWIKAGIADYTGTECGVEKFIEVAKKKGIWVENDAFVPQIGDACVYDWDDGPNYATTDNTGSGDHIGIVTSVDTLAKTFVVTEGNTNGGRVGKRTVSVNGRYIRGFIAPNYSKIAAELIR